MSYLELFWEAGVESRSNASESKEGAVVLVESALVLHLSTESQS